MAERFDLGAYLKRAVPESGTGQPVLETVDIDRIQGDDRNFYQLDGIEELAANIQLLGLQQPPVVRRDGDRLVLVSGHRRLAALRLLVKEGAEQFRQVPVLIQERPGSEAMQELALIFANRDTRRMTSPEVARQAERVQELLYRLKDEGVEFPGRMRDHVAEACRVTRTRLGNLRVIRQGLAGELLPLWEKGDISEDTALKLARLPGKYQQRIVRANRAKHNGKVQWLYASTVETMGRRFARAEALTCDRTGGGPCGNRDSMLELLEGKGADYYGPCGGQCCSVCPSLISCRHACPECAAEKTAAREEEKARKQKAAAALEAAQRPDLELLELVWGRFAAAKARAGLSDEELMGEKCWGIRYPRYELGEFRKAQEGRLTADSRIPLPEHIGAGTVRRMQQLARALGCSLDYLFGLDDRPEPEPAAEAGGWRKGEPPEGTRVLCLFRGSSGRCFHRALWFDRGRYWFDEDRELEAQMRPEGWFPMPETDC